ncbi:MAG: hypothetical protein CMJ18_11575 [Phycisphaeraceae bacterium]|nr:hypothetical protein [Phycisphaeraceae bacterium]
MFLSLLLTQIASLVLGVHAARRIRTRSPDATPENVHRRCRPLLPGAIGLLMILAVPASAIVFDRVCQLYPLWFQRYMHVATWVVLLMMFPFLFALAASLAVHTNHPKKRIILVAATIMNVALVQFQWTRAVPIASRLASRATGQGILLQSSGSSCVATSLANATTLLGSNLSEKEAAELLGTTRTGTHNGQLRYALDRLGYAYETLNRGYHHLADVPPPAILFVDHPKLGRESHAVLFVAHRRGRYEIWDPLTGRELATAQQIDANWHGNGVRVISPTHQASQENPVRIAE